MRNFKFLYRRMSSKPSDKQSQIKKQNHKVTFDMNHKSQNIAKKPHHSEGRIDSVADSEITESSNESKPFFRKKFFNEMLLKISVMIIIISIVLYYPHGFGKTSNVKQVLAKATETQIPAESNVVAKNVQVLWPTVSLGLLVRNKAYVLPYFLYHLHQLDYPKERMEVIIYADFCVDESIEILRKWVELNKNSYHRLEFEYDDTDRQTANQSESQYWNSDHFSHLIALKQSLLDTARDSWADYFLSLDTDVILTDRETLKTLIETSENSKSDEPISIIAPMLNCTNSEAYSNFWGDMQENGYYKRSPDYFDIQKRLKKGVFPAAVVHSVFLINLKHEATKNIRFHPPPQDYQGPIDDLIIFARVSQSLGVNLWIDNRRLYGFFHAPVSQKDLRAVDESNTFMDRWYEREKELFQHLKLQVMIDTEGTVEVKKDSNLWKEKEPELVDFGFDKIYVVNLERRARRLSLMKYCLAELGIKWDLFDAIDGRNLNESILQQWGVKQMDGYIDPYHKRALKYGEIGCFLSHYSIWQEMLDKNYSSILIFEDDVRFSTGFVGAFWDVLEEADVNIPDWELMYLGRKRMSKKERRVENTMTLSWPDYTYWTLAYALNRKGAEKLVAQKPLSKMIAVDEYIPIMFNRHPNEDWLTKFSPRDLVAISTEPLLVEPCHYTGEPLYQSDTEDSPVILGIDDKNATKISSE